MNINRKSVAGPNWKNKNKTNILNMILPVLETAVLNINNRSINFLKNVFVVYFIYTFYLFLACFRSYTNLCNAAFLHMLAVGGPGLLDSELRRRRNKENE